MTKQFGFQKRNSIMEALYWFFYYWTKFAWHFFWGTNQIPVVADNKTLKLSS